MMAVGLRFAAPQSVALPGDEIPIDSDHAPVLKSFQRFRKDEIARAFTLFEANNSKFSSALASLNCHDAIVFNLRLQMPILSRLLPKGIRFRPARPLHYLRKSRRLHFHQFHEKKVRQRTTAKKIRLPLLHSCPGGVRKPSVHSP